MVNERTYVLYGMHSIHTSHSFPFGNWFPRQFLSEMISVLWNDVSIQCQRIMANIEVQMNSSKPPPLLNAKTPNGSATVTSHTNWPVIDSIARPTEYMFHENESTCDAFFLFLSLNVTHSYSTAFVCVFCLFFFLSGKLIPYTFVVVFWQSVGELSMLCVLCVCFLLFLYIWDISDLVSWSRNVTLEKHVWRGHRHCPEWPMSTMNFSFLQVAWTDKVKF